MFIGVAAAAGLVAGALYKLWDEDMSMLVGNKDDDGQQQVEELADRAEGSMYPIHRGSVEPVNDARSSEDRFEWYSMYPEGADSPAIEHVMHRCQCWCKQNKEDDSEKEPEPPKGPDKSVLKHRRERHTCHSEDTYTPDIRLMPNWRIRESLRKQLEEEAARPRFEKAKDSLSIYSPSDDEDDPPPSSRQKKSNVDYGEWLKQKAGGITILVDKTPPTIKLRKDKKSSSEDPRSKPKEPPRQGK